jgi:tRNA pseudouridine13 synthase
MDIDAAREKERELLREIKAARPDLVPSMAWEDSPEFMRTFGIAIPGASSLPRAYLKLFPSDFIVEEVRPDGTVLTISAESDELPPEEPGRHVRATLVKCGLGTMEAIEAVAAAVRTDPSRIQFAGLKDRDAMTAQDIIILDADADLVRAAREGAGWFLKDIRASKAGLAKGSLSGNRFSLFMRTYEGDEAALPALMRQVEHVREHGFLNYYYLQRFGTPRLVNYAWGLSIVMGDYKGAVESVLFDPGLRELPYFRALREEARSVWPDAAAVKDRFSDFPLALRHEHAILAALMERPGDYAGALRAVEEQVVLWVYAFSSLIFNEHIAHAVEQGSAIPATLPLVLSPDRRDQGVYEAELRALGCFPLPHKNLERFRGIYLKHREVATRDRARIEAIEAEPEGVCLRFRLGKGEYATTFLAHLFTLVGGEPADRIRRGIKDTDAVLGGAGNNETLRYFAGENVGKGEE